MNDLMNACVLLISLPGNKGPERGKNLLEFIASREVKTWTFGLREAMSAEDTMRDAHGGKG